MLKAPNSVHFPASTLHHLPSREIIDKCVHCRFCHLVCPTYVLWGQEMDSPRGCRGRVCKQ